MREKQVVHMSGDAYDAQSWKAEPHEIVQPTDTLHEIPMPDGSVLRLLLRELCGSRSIRAYRQCGHEEILCYIGLLDGVPHWMTYDGCGEWIGVRPVTEDEAQAIDRVLL